MALDKIQLTQGDIQLENVCENTESKYIIITDDKLENILSRYIENLKKSNLWITYLALTISILLSILTAEFNKDFIGISKEYWTAIFIVVLGISTFLLIKSVIISLFHFNEVKLDSLIKKIKNEDKIPAKGKT